MCMFAVIGTGQGLGVRGSAAHGSIPDEVIAGTEVTGDSQLVPCQGKFKKACDMIVSGLLFLRSGIN